MIQVLYCNLELWNIVIGFRCFLASVMVIADAESPGPLKKRPRLSLKVQKNNESKDVKVGKEETDQGGENGKE